MSSRKRRAPGASPQAQQQPTPFTPDMADTAGDQFMSNWNDTMSGDMSNAFNASSFLTGLNEFTDGFGAASGPSTHNRIVSLDGTETGTAGHDNSTPGQLVRRNPNQQLAARGTPWEDLDSNGQQGWPIAEDDDEELEQKALLAKKDAQAKRKQIPPFVQKLSSFLDDNKNTTLIRWSDDGNSFIVIDEDEFARTLIPELFKHNNYASFVRQLNMYGFHKKVGLSDNSMKASETKAKAPSEYYNKYFKRGRPELLWLIQKPKNPPPGPKRKRDDDGKRGDSDEDRTYQDGGGGGYEESMAVRANQEMTMIPRNEYNSLRSEVRTLQQQQKVISNVLGQIRRQNDQLYQQATAFQTLHDRHENSINAILTFLATFYNRTLEGNNGANLADMFGTATAQQQQSNVVDVSDLPDGSMGKSPQMHRQGRRPLALLPAPTSKDGLHAERTATLSPSARSPAAPSPIAPPASRPNTFRSSSSQNRASPAPAGVGTRSASAAPPAQGESPGMSSLPENDEIMSAIQNVNASQPTSQTPQFDFPAALANYQIQGGNVPLTPQQRNEVLSLMANNTSAASPNSTLAHNANNAMVSPQAPPMPDIRQFQATQAQLDLLQKMSEEQNTRVQSLHERLQPLSPSGQIPGMNNYFGTASLGEPGTYDLDLDNFTHGDDYFPQNAATGQDDSDIALPDLNFDLTNATTNLNGANFDGAADADMLGFDGADAQGGRVESVSSSATSPAATVEDVDEEEDRLTKRRKKGAYRA